MIHDTKNVGKPTVLTCRFPTFYGCLLQHVTDETIVDHVSREELEEIITLYKLLFSIDDK